MFYISLALFFIAGIIFIMLCVTFKSVCLDKPKKSYAQKTFEKIEEDSRKAVELNMKDVSKKETKYNTTWKKVWDKQEFKYE